MSELNKELNIFQRMYNITNDMPNIGKGMSVGSGNYKYKAVGEDDVIEPVKMLEKLHRVYSYPVSREVMQSENINKNKIGDKPAYTFFSRIKTTYRFVNIDNPKDYMEVTSFSEGIDTGDKGGGKAMTYGDKYALMKAYKIRTGEDADQDASPNYSNNYNKTTPQSDAERNQTEREVMDHIFMKCKQDKVNSRIVMSMLLTTAGVGEFKDIKVIKDKDVKKMVKDAMIKLDIEYK